MMARIRNAWRRNGRRRNDRGRNDRGQASIELLGTIPYLALALIASLQLIFAVATVQATSTVSAERAVPSWVVNRMEVQVGGGSQPAVRVTSSIPILFPGLFNGPRVTRTAWFDPEQGVAPWG